MTTEKKIEILEMLGYKVTPKCFENSPPHSYLVTGNGLEDEYIEIIGQTMPEIMKEIARETYNKGYEKGCDDSY